MVALRAGTATDVGLVRSNNQDSFLAADPLYAVADGMGGAAAGEVASALAVEALKNGFARTAPPSADLLLAAAQAANRAVWDEAEAHPEMRGMGTTLVAIALVEGPELAIINIGDSRLYVLAGGELRQVTFDHNLVAEMVAEGRITPAEAEFHPRRNIMTRALGVEPEVPIDLFVEEARPGDRYLLCSDGLPRELNDDRIAHLLRSLAEPGEAAKALVEEAKAHGGNDNITVVVVDVVDQAAATDRTGAAPADPTTAVPAEAAGPAAKGRVAGGGEAAGSDARGKTAGATGAGRAAGPTAAGRAPDDTTALLIPRERAPEAGLLAPRAGPSTRRRPRGTSRPVLTVRVVAFLILLVLILAAAAAAIVWYGRSSYFVGLRGNQIVIYQGRPGGVLGLDPTLKQTTAYTTADVLPVALPALKAGQQEPSVSTARQYVQNLVNAYIASQTAAGAAGPGPVTSSTTSPDNSAPTTAAPAPTTTHPKP